MFIYTNKSYEKASFNFWALAQAGTCLLAVLLVLPSTGLGSSTSLSAHNLEPILQLHCIVGPSGSIF